MIELLFSYIGWFFPNIGWFLLAWSLLFPDKTQRLINQICKIIGWQANRQGETVEKLTKTVEKLTKIEDTITTVVEEQKKQSNKLKEVNKEVVSSTAKVEQLWEEREISYKITNQDWEEEDHNRLFELDTKQVVQTNPKELVPNIKETIVCPHCKKQISIEGYSEGDHSLKCQKCGYHIDFYIRTDRNNVFITVNYSFNGYPSQKNKLWEALNKGSK